MEISTNSATFPPQLPLPLYSAVRVGEASSGGGEIFSLYIGLDKNVVAKLKKLSLDPTDIELDANTSDRKRFGEGSYEDWYAKKRVPFALVHEKTGALAALAWYGPKPLGRKSLKHLSDTERALEGAQKEDVWHTIVFRSYPPFRGKGLMRDFILTTMDIYRHYFPEAKLWAGIQDINPASIALAERLGFKKHSQDGHLVVMTEA